ncbi:Leucine Rich Repeat [Seminavis robusta]|uniref:Leucine Rich Repeat n=1 Tax=Seminavis robusta TaxID=568900 RepID=A0A9N8HXS9_9STRA|nr:Leucine Rich Repeat [Seminavis robusta]|eukprot:Sro2607_g332450.1 Leucine Rich Repeat (614) ;mRNA; r:5816-7900
MHVSPSEVVPGSTANDLANGGSHLVIDKTVAQEGTAGDKQEAIEDGTVCPGTISNKGSNNEAIDVLQGVPTSTPKKVSKKETIDPQLAAMGTPVSVEEWMAVPRKRASNASTSSTTHHGSSSDNDDDDAARSFSAAPVFRTVVADTSLPGAYASAPGFAYLSNRLPGLHGSLVGHSSRSFQGDSPTHASFNHDGSLVEARLVSEEGTIATAQPADTFVRRRPQRSCCGGSPKSTACLCLLGATIGAGVIVLLLWGGGVLRQSSTANQSDHIGRPTTPATLSPYEYLAQYLPADSIVSAEQDPRSPQALAIEWFVQDPFLRSYSTRQRIQQRFALATIFYALNGTTWTKNREWLSYDHHECSWYSGPSEDVIHVPKPAQSPCRGDANILTAGNKSTHEWYTHLWLGRNNLNGVLPVRELSLLSNLESIDMGYGHVRGKLFTKDLLQLSNLKEMSLLTNQISGTLMTEIGLMTNLEVLLMGKRGNNFQGGLPSELGLLTDLHVCSLSGSDFTGTIPTEIGSMSSLRVLGLAGTLLTGPMPSEIGLLSSMWLTYFFRSQLSGQVPSEIAQLKELSWFHIQDNVFSGTIPTQFGAMPSMRELAMTGNHLTGTIPWES